MSGKKPSPEGNEKEKAVEALVYRLKQAGYGRAGEEREEFAREYVDMMWARGLRVMPVGRPEAWKATTGQPAGEARPPAYEEARASLGQRPRTAPPRPGVA